ncbi:MAG: hypothetical protein ABI862_15085 [Ilumatobacteraceae bacterium]
MSAKRADLDANPVVSLTYWDATHDTSTANCDVVWEVDDTSKRVGWDRFATAPGPVGYDPRLIPGWTDPTAAEFGIIRLEPRRLRVMPGLLMINGNGSLLRWSA